jgi:CBS domain protein
LCVLHFNDPHLIGEKQSHLCTSCTALLRCRSARTNCICSDWGLPVIILLYLQAISIIRELGIQSVPVTGSDGKVVGVVDVLDIAAFVAKVEPVASEKDRWVPVRLLGYTAHLCCTPGCCLCVISPTS